MMRHFGLKAAALAAGIMLLAASHAAAQCSHTPQIVISNAGPGPWSGTHTFNLTEQNTINSLLATGCFFSGHTNQREAVFEFNAPSTGTYIINTNGSTLGGVDTKIWIFTNCSSPVATQVGCNDDISGTNYLSEATVTLNAGTTYFISLEGWNSTANGEVGNINIIFAPPPPANDLCAGALGLAPLPSSDTVNLGLCSDEGFNGSSIAGQNGRDVFYTFTPTTTGDYRYFGSGAGGTVNTAVTICTGTCGTLTEEVSENLYTGGEIVFRTLVSGTPYTFVTEGATTATVGTIISGLSGPVAASSSGGDDCATPITVGTVPYTETGIDMSRNDNWLNFSGVTYAGDRIYAFTAPSDGSFRFTCTPTTPTFDPMMIGLTTDCGTLALFPGSPFADNTGAGEAESMDVLMTSGATVKVYLQDFNGFGGLMNFSIQDATRVVGWSEM